MEFVDNTIIMITSNCHAFFLRSVLVKLSVIVISTDVWVSSYMGSFWRVTPIWHHWKPVEGA